MKKQPIRADQANHYRFNGAEQHIIIYYHEVQYLQIHGSAGLWQSLLFLSPCSKYCMITILRSMVSNSNPDIILKWFKNLYFEYLK